MKKTILLTGIFLLILIAGKSQINFPSPADNPFWIEQHDQLWACGTMGTHGSCGDYYCMHTMPAYYKTDTIINGITYNRLYTRIAVGYAISPHQPVEGCPHSFYFQEPERLYATIRQDTALKRVYILDNNSEHLLYDFGNMLVGQLYPATYNTWSDSLIVASEDSILMADLYHKKWNLGRIENGVIHDEGFVSIIEGVGSTYGIVANLTLPFENWDEMLCFSLNGTAMYPDSSYNCDVTIGIQNLEVKPDFVIYPNPATSYLVVEADEPPAKACYLEIFNPNGIKVLEKQIETTTTFLNLASLSNGIYFVRIADNGKLFTQKFIKRQ
jgi:hypothetical protein